MSLESLPYLHAAGDGGPRSSTQLIVIHATDNTASASAEASYATHREDQTSTHFYVDDAGAIRVLPLDHIAYGCLWHGNQISVQLELCGQSNHLSDATMRRAAPIVAELCRRYSIPMRKISAAEVRAGGRGICGHADITAAFPQDGGDHTDPGSHFPWDQFIRYITGGTTTMGMETDDPKAWSALASAAEMAGYLRDGAEQTWDHKPVQAVKLLHQVATDVQTLKSTPAPVAMSAQDKADIIAGLAQAVSPIVQAACEAATRTVLGGLDGATPAGS